VELVKDLIWMIFSINSLEEEDLADSEEDQEGDNISNLTLVALVEEDLLEEVHLEEVHLEEDILEQDLLDNSNNLKRKFQIFFKILMLLG
jgi:hypothetical protein